MNEDREQSALAVFRGACELPRGERAAFLESACGTDRDLRAKVESMLAWDDIENRAADRAELPQPIRAALEGLAHEAESGQAIAGSAPETVGSYRIIRLLASGGMGDIYEGEQQNPVRRVAIKVARTSGTTSERAKRFELEAQLLARLRHPGIAQIIEAGTTRPEDGARPFFAMEFVEGRTLTDHAHEHLHSAREKLELMVKVCAAVAFAHSHGVTHRDLKPDNVLIDEDGAPKVLDFGVAKVEEAGGFGAATLRTVAGRILGTMGYMAPEQLAGKTDEVGPAADVYSLGVILYQLLTGRLPHDLEAATIARALAIVTTTDAPPLSVVRPEFRGDIEALIAKALEKDLHDRYPDAAALQADLDRYLRGEPILARQAGPLRRVTKWGRRNPVLATAVFGVFVALAAAATVLLVKNQEVGAALAEFELLADSKRLERAIKEADELVPARRDKVDAMLAWLREYRRLTAPEDLEGRRIALADIRRRAIDTDDVRWTFDDDGLQLKHDVLAKLVDDLAAFAAETGRFAQIEARLDMARKIDKVTVADREGDWLAAIDRIRQNYGGLTIPPQVGLIPLGPDDSGLEEFLHYETHGGPIPPAGHGARDTLGFSGNSPWPETGLVFVLIPGGAALLGAQSKDEDGRNYDPHAIFSDSEVREVTIAPFFLSKYEMTQAQWSRVAGDDPSAVKGPVLPVTDVDWTRCTEIMRRLGLVLPDDEQLEYAAREGPDSEPGSKPIWWTGDDVHTLAGKENVFDETTARKNRAWHLLVGAPAPFEDEKKQRRFDAGDSGLADVGSYAANALGLYDIGGNVTEWCSNGNAYGRFVRGGNYRRPPWFSRTAFRRPASERDATPERGLRPAMNVRSAALH